MGGNVIRRLFAKWLVRHSVRVELRDVRLDGIDVPGMFSMTAVNFLRHT